MSHATTVVARVRAAQARRVRRLLPGRRRRRRRALTASLAALCVLAASCGGSATDSVAAPAGDSVAPVAAAAPSADSLPTRVHAGIAVAGGDPGSVQGQNPCNQPGAEPVTIAYVGANLTELDAIGLETTVVEDPALIIAAYVNQVNFTGGIDGRCVELLTYLWSLADPVGSFTDICTKMAERPPVLYFSLTLLDALLECATVRLGIPTISLYTAIPEASFVRTQRTLFIDDGTVEKLLERSLTDARGAGIIDGTDRIGLLQGSGPSAGMGVMFSEARIEMQGFEHVATADVLPEYGDLQLLLSEKQVRLLESGLTDAERQEARRNLEALPPDLAQLYAQMEEFYTEAATRFRDAGVTAVVATASWTDLRRMMRAAEGIDWTPTWIANDIQPATVVMADIPRRQAQNIVQVSARRAAGDEVPPLDQGCITMRNTAVEADPFAHRPHSDAWNLITSVCDYLDVFFGALTRVDGSITRESLISVLNETSYDSPHGGLITFSAANRSGAERFRVLRPDVDCVLNFWGCMRSTTDWLPPSGAGAG